MSKKTGPRCNFHLYDKKKTEAGTIIWKCLVCPHWTRNELIEGMPAICRYCEKEFVMNKDSLQAKPHCGCRFTKRKKIGVDKEESVTNTDLLNDLLGKV